MKKLIAILLTLVLCLGLTACGADTTSSVAPSDNSESSAPDKTEPEAVVTKVLTLKGPTGIGMAKMMEDNKNGKYEFTVAGQPTEAVAAVSSVLMIMSVLVIVSVFVIISVLMIVAVLVIFTVF